MPVTYPVVLPVIVSEIVYDIITSTSMDPHYTTTSGDITHYCTSLFNIIIFGNAATIPMCFVLLTYVDGERIVLDDLDTSRERNIQLHILYWRITSRIALIQLTSTFIHSPAAARLHISPVRLVAPGINQRSPGA